MTKLRKVLAYQVKMSWSIAMLLAIVASVIVMNMIWANAPWGIFILIGAALRVIADAWKRKKARIRPDDGGFLS